MEPLDKTLLDELSERVENLDAQIEYKNTLVMDAQVQAKDTAAGTLESIAQQIKSVSTEEMKHLRLHNVRKVDANCLLYV